MDEPEFREPDPNWKPKKITETKIKARRQNKISIFKNEEDLLAKGLLKIAPEGVAPAENELPYVCEAGKTRHFGQASMTEAKKTCIGSHPKIIGQIPFCAKKGEACVYGQIPAFGDNPGDKFQPFDGRLVPHQHSFDGKCVRRNDNHECYECIPNTKPKSLGKKTDEEWRAEDEAVHIAKQIKEEAEKRLTEEKIKAKMDELRGTV